MTFILDDRLQNDTIKLASWPLCEVLLMNDSQFPWVILVPRVADISELYHLDERQHQLLNRESLFLAETLMSTLNGDKMNIAALGNVVKQLHIHHVVRFESDLAWPAPIWGKQPVLAYSQDALDSMVSTLRCLSDKEW